MRRDIDVNRVWDRPAFGPVRWFIATALVVASGVGLSAQTDRMQKISSMGGGFTGELLDGGGFGTQLVALGDLDGDGISELAVSAPGPFDQPDRDIGSVWIIYLNSDGTVRDQIKLPKANVDPGVATGIGLGALGDQDGDGIPEIAVSSRESFYMVRLNADGLPKPQRAFPFFSGGGVRFSVFRAIDKLVAFGAPWADGVYLWQLSIVDGGVTFRVAATEDFFGEDEGGGFGYALAGMDVGSEPVLFVGAPEARNRGLSSGAVHLLQFDEIPVGASPLDVNLRGLYSIDIPPTSSIGSLDAGDWFGASVASAGDLNRDGQGDLAVGAPGDDDAGPDRGAVWFLFLTSGGSVIWHDKMSASTWPDLTDIQDEARFGTAIAPVGDLDGDGVVDFAVGAPGDDDGGPDRGAVYILFSLDRLRPGLALASVPSIPITVGTTQTVAAQVSSVSDLSSVDLVFTRGGDTGEFATAMREYAPGLYSGDIPAFAVGERGIEYYVIARNQAGRESRLPETGVFSSQVRMPNGLSFRAPGGGQANGYRLVSAPLALERSDAASVLEDDLGSYDPAEWRLYGTSDTGDQVEFDEDTLHFKPGRAFWFLVRGENVQVNTGPGTSVRSDRAFEISLRQGWNLVANPFAFPIPLSNLTLRSGAAIDILAYNGGWGAVPDSAIAPFAGYIVFSNRVSETLVVDPDVRVPATGKSLHAAGELAFDSRLEWAIRVKAEKGQSRDHDNVLGVSRLASDDWNEMDRPEPPAVWDYVSVSFPHEEWRRGAVDFRTDVRGASCMACPERASTCLGEHEELIERRGVHGASIARSCRWVLEVNAASGGAVELSFEGMESVPRELAVWLHDPASGVWQDLRVDNHLTVVVSGNGAGPDERAARSGRTLEIRVGPATETLAFRQSAAELELSAFPNPFSRSVTIAYGLPEDAEVDLEVFNALGQRVATLPDSGPKTAGRHALVWDAVSGGGHPLTPGIYIVRIAAGGATRSKSMTLTR